MISYDSRSLRRSAKKSVVQLSGYTPIWWNESKLLIRSPTGRQSLQSFRSAVSTTDISRTPSPLPYLQRSTFQTLVKMWNTMEKQSENVQKPTENQEKPNGNVEKSSEMGMWWGYKQPEYGDIMEYSAIQWDTQSLYIYMEFTWSGKIWNQKTTMEIWLYLTHLLH